LLFLATLLQGDELHLGIDAVGYITKDIGCTLLTILLDEERLCSLVTHRRSYLIATDGGTSDGLENLDPTDVPLDGWLPEDTLEDVACCRGRDDIITDTLDLELGSCETGKVTTYL
jgi:hypothetical protein